MAAVLAGAEEIVANIASRGATTGGEELIQAAAVRHAARGAEIVEEAGSRLPLVVEKEAGLTKAQLLSRALGGVTATGAATAAGVAAAGTTALEAAKDAYGVAGSAMGAYMTYNFYKSLAMQGQDNNEYDNHHQFYDEQAYGYTPEEEAALQEDYEKKMSLINNASQLLTDTQRGGMAPITPLNNNRLAVPPEQALAATEYVDKLLAVKQNKTHFVC